MDAHIRNGELVYCNLSFFIILLNLIFKNVSKICWYSWWKGELYASKTIFPKVLNISWFSSLLQYFYCLFFLACMCDHLFFVSRKQGLLTNNTNELRKEENNGQHIISIVFFVVCVASFNDHKNVKLFECCNEIVKLLTIISH